MAKIVVVVLALALAGCQAAGQSQQVQGFGGADAIQSVTLLFVHDGVKMYRFYDGRTHYFAVPVRPGERIDVLSSESCGKNCTRDAVIATLP